MSKSNLVETVGIENEVVQEARSKTIKGVEGVVVRKKSDKTVVVLVTRRIKHPVYGKIYKQSKKFHAHDEHSVCQEGDLVLIQSSLPISKLKRWRLVQINKKFEKTNEPC